MNFSNLSCLSYLGGQKKAPPTKSGLNTDKATPLLWEFEATIYFLRAGSTEALQGPIMDAKGHYGLLAKSFYSAVFNVWSACPKERLLKALRRSVLTPLILLKPP